jgi:hypothetical protein
MGILLMSFESLEILKAVWSRTRIVCYVTPRHWLMVSDILKEYCALEMSESDHLATLCHVTAAGSPPFFLIKTRK